MSTTDNVLYKVVTHSPLGYSKRHGGPYDRGSADAYYMRRFDPHYFENDTYATPRIEIKEGTTEYEAYLQGWNDTIEAGDFKEWG